jgi:hypothetical protein
MRIHMQDRTDNAANLIESDAVAVGLQNLLINRAEWTGTFTELLNALDGFVDIAKRQNKSWPQSAQALSNRIRHAAPALRNLGMEVTFDKESHTRRRLVTLRKSPQESVPSDPECSESLHVGSEPSSVHPAVTGESTGGTGDAKLQPTPLSAEARPGEIQQTEEPEDPNTPCPSCGRVFKSDFARRIHALTGLCKRRAS